MLYLNLNLVVLKWFISGRFVNWPYARMKNFCINKKLRPTTYDKSPTHKEMLHRQSKSAQYYNDREKHLK